MPRQLSSATTLENLKKEAKRRLKALRAGQPDGMHRLRDAQLELARDYGCSGWAELKTKVEAIESKRAGAPSDAPLEALLRAAEQGRADDVARLLDEHPQNIDVRGTLDGHSGLRTALHFGVQHEAVVRVLLERGANPNIRDEGDNAFPLHFAAERHDMPVIRLLVEHGAQLVAGEVDDHAMDIIGWATVFYYVPPNPEVVDYLLSHGARHTLFSAVAVGDVEAIRTVISRAPEQIDRRMDRTNRGGCALHLAVVKKQRRALETLLDLGADTEAADAASLTALDQAALDGEREMAALLLARGARMHVPAAAILQRTGDLERLLQEDPGCLRPGGRYATLIIRAAERASAEVVERLVALGADINVQDASETSIDGTRGYTALHAAAWEGNSATASALLHHGADPRIRDERYCATPAGWANYNHKAETRDLILQSGRIDIFDAISLDRPDLIRPILERDPEALHRPYGRYATCEPEASELSPLAFATFTDKPAAVRVLGSQGAELATGGLLARTPLERAAAFLRMACLDWAVGGPERGRQTHAASRLLRRHPEIARDSIWTAVACGELEEVTRILAANASAASAPGGPRGWPPLLYLCSARLAAPGKWSENAVAIARALLDHGADPNAYYHGGNESIHYTAITCLIGRGEEQAAVHPQARELAALLLERGAEPNDMQFFYNAFAGHASQRYLAEDDFVWLLELMYQRSLALGRAAQWEDPDWNMLGMGAYGSGAWYLLSNAIKVNAVALAEWALSHGANPNALPGPDHPAASLYEHAVRTGRSELAALLARYGARTSAAGSRTVDDHSRVFEAAEQDRVEDVAAMLDRGLSPDIERENSRTRLLHVAAYSGATRVVTLLIERGAEIDPRDADHGTTPIYWAYWGQRPACVDLLAPLSRDVWALVPAGKLDRLRDVLKEDPRLATTRYEGGTPLFFLPDDELVAAEIAKLLIAHGADPAFKRKDGTFAADIARARGLDRAADLLR